MNPNDTGEPGLGEIQNMPNYVPNETIYTSSQIFNRHTAENISTMLPLTSIEQLTDPVYRKLVALITDETFHVFNVKQRFQNIGTSMPLETYKGVLREIALMQRVKGVDFPWDRPVKPTEYYNLQFSPEEIAIRYHAAHFRWMYGYDIIEAELINYTSREKRGYPIGALTAGKAANYASAYNLFADQLRLTALSLLAENSVYTETTSINLLDGEALTSADCRNWLMELNRILRLFRNGTTVNNFYQQYIQTPPETLQIVMLEEAYDNLRLRLSPDTYNPGAFESIMPQNVMRNLVLVDSFGRTRLLDGTGNPVDATYDNEGMSLLSWQPGYTTGPLPSLANTQCFIMDKRAINFQPRLRRDIFVAEHAELLRAPFRGHKWDDVHISDIWPMCRIDYEAP